MKKQINPSTKAHLLRSALILLSLLAICAIPFALADIVLYDQLNNPGTSATSSEEQLGSPQFTDFAADDFFVPSGETWVITEVDAQGVNGVVVPENFNVFFYQIGSGGLPGTQVYAATAQPYVNNAGVFQVTLTAPAVLTTGNYFVSVQAHISGSENPTWRWMDRIGQAGALAAWQNPGGGFDSCFTWGARITCVGDAGAPGQMFRIIGTIGAFGTPSPTPTGTPSPTATGTPSPSATCARPTPGSCVSYEAEDNTLTGSAFVLSCPTCSEEEKVGYVGNNSGTLQFNAIGVVVPGMHSMTICYTNGDAVRYALLTVNSSQVMPLSFPSTGSFQTVGSIQTTVVLNTGCNTLVFSNPIVGSWAPDFDRIQFNCPTCTVSATLTTNAASNITRSSARLNGTVNPNALTTTVHFEYGTRANYGSTTASWTYTGNTTQSVSVRIPRLRANTRYHFRLVETNNAGTSYGSDRTFRTRR